MFEFEHLVKKMPQNVNRVISKVENGELTVKYSEDFAPDLERVSNKMSAAIVIAALLLGFPG